MLKDRIAAHFVGMLGFDVSVSMNDPVTPTELVLYRPKPLRDEIVSVAFSMFEEADPEAAEGIDAVYVCYIGSVGRTRKRVRVRSGRGAADSSMVPPVISAGSKPSKGQASNIR